MVKTGIKGLDQFTKNIEKLGSMEVKMGFLGEEKNQRSDGDITNVELAFQHHFGVRSQNLPARNLFLGFQEKNLVNKMKNVLTSSLEKAVEKNQLNMQAERLALKRAGLIGENILDETFATGGFGKWKKLSPSTIAQKEKNKEWILVHEGELKKSRISKVTNINQD